MTTCSKPRCERRATRRGMCHSHYETHRTRQKAYGRWETLYSDAGPARRHVEQLAAHGMGSRTIAELSGVSRNNIRYLLMGRRGRPITRMMRRNVDRILAVEIPSPITLPNNTVIDATGTTRRLRALVAAGYTQHQICRFLDILPGNSTRLFAGKGQVTASTARKVVAVYDALSMTPGSSERSRARARRLGWAPPLAWDDDTIDDPTAEPDLGAKRAVLFPERYAEWRELGYSDLEILGRMQIHPESLLRQLDRYGIKADPELVREATSRKHRKAVS